MGHFARKCRAPRIQDRGRREIYKQGSKEEEQVLKALMVIDGVGWHWSYMANEEENHALVADKDALTEFTLMLNPVQFLKMRYLITLSVLNLEIRFYEKIRGLEFDVKNKNNKIERLMNELEQVKKEKEGLDSKLTGFESGSKDLDTLLKDMSWTGLPEFANDIITGYSRPSPSVESNSSDLQNSHSSVFEHGESSESIMSKPMIKFVKSTDSPSNNINDKGYWDSGCSRHMSGNISYLSDYASHDGGYVSFIQGGGKITGKGIIKTGKLEFKNVYFVKDLKYNLFSMSQICDNKNSVLFTDSKCIVLVRDFKLKDDTNVLLRTPRQHNMHSIDLNNIVSYNDLTCLVTKASADESMLWHRRLGHLNFKTMNKLVRHNLFKGLPSKCFENDHTCVACLKGKQHKASCKTKLVNSVSKPLHTLHMDLFGPTSDETSGILRNFITEIENLKDLKVKIIRGEFSNKEMNEFYIWKGIKREFSNARSP
nr:hypothetical protein [Tanacetum cinerariifolium]